MENIRQFFIVFIYACVVLKVGGIEGSFQRQSSFGSKSYADLINDARMMTQYADALIDSETMQLTDTYQDNSFDLFQYFYNRRKIVERRKYLLPESGFERDSLLTPDGAKRGDEGTLYTNYVELILKEALGKLEEIYERDVADNVTSQCGNDTARLIVGLLTGQSWSYQFLDATGKPGPALTKKQVNFVGDYDECRAAVAPSVGQNDSFWDRNAARIFEGNYCVVEVLPKLLPQIGFCVPSSCNSEQVANFTSELLNISIIAECRNAPTKMTTATIFAIIILTTVGTMMILGTFYDLMTKSRYPDKKLITLPVNLTTQDSTEPEPVTQNGDGNASTKHQSSTTSMNDEDTPLLFNSKKNKSTALGEANSSSSSSSGPISKILLAFSVYSNGQKILSTAQASGSLGAIHGIRFLSMSWVVLCHTFLNVPKYTVNSPTAFPQLLHRWTFLPIANGFSSVDTFFTLSGLLTSYLTIKEMSRRDSWKINWPLFYFHRFWRLTPPYMFSLVIVLGLTQYMGQGALWNNLQPSDKIFCEKNWWTNLLYVNNLVNSEEMCFGHSWYLANDMQFFVLSPLMLIPFHFNRFAGMLSCLAFLIITTVTTGALSSEKAWPSTLISAAGIGKYNASWFQDYYIKPWCRMGPFIVGILAGYILSRTKGKPFKMPAFVVIVGWILAFGAGFAVVYGVRGDVSGYDQSSTGVAALYNAVSRSIWGLCVSWVIIACSAGYGGPIQALLSWSPFVVLGRLTYMSYLIHLCIVGVFCQNLGSLLYLSDTTMMAVYLGILVFVNMAAFVFVLALESPMMGLEKAFIRKDNRR